MVARSVYAADFAVACWVLAHISVWVCWVDCTLSTAVSYDWDEQLTLMIGCVRLMLGCVGVCRTLLLRLRTMTWMLLLNSQWKTDEEWVQLFIFPVCFANIIRNFLDELYANCFIGLTRHFTIIGFRDIRIVIVIMASCLIAVIKWSYNVIICFRICPITSPKSLKCCRNFFDNVWVMLPLVLLVERVDCIMIDVTHDRCCECRHLITMRPGVHTAHYRCAAGVLLRWLQTVMDDERSLDWCCRVLRECSRARETRHYRLWWRSLWKLRCVAFVWRLPVSPCALLLSLATQEHE